MSVKLLPLVLLITTKPCRSSLVIDSGGQTGLHYSDYCPNMKYCPEGSHVMCMHNPNSKFGPHCFNPINSSVVELTADIAGQILDIVNTIRSKIAQGKEITAKGKPFPRGYGIFRLKWDSELATFAQLLANQCFMKHDLCRATKRFPLPTQLITIQRFSIPDWNPLKSSLEIETPGLTKYKIIWTVQNILKIWYTSKKRVTEEMVKFCPDFYTLQSNNTLREARGYMALIQGEATHMGCGISAYTDFNINSQNQLQIVCNFSGGLRQGFESYEMFPPIPNQGYSPKCGCPPGSEEDADCLCNEVKPLSPPEPTCPYGENSGHDCDSTLVLLPIFTMEDAPTEKLYQVAEKVKDPLKNYILQRVDNTSNGIARQGNMGDTPSPLEMLDFFHQNEGEAGIWQRAHQPILSKSSAPSYTKLHRESQASPIFRIGPDFGPPPPPPRENPAVRPSLSGRGQFTPPPPPPRKLPPPPPPGINLYTTSQKTHESRPAASHDKRSRQIPKPPSKRRGFTKKASIFTRVAQFQLPKRRSMASSLKNIKKDVAPRKDFSNLNKVVNDYLKRRPGYKIIENNHEKYQSTDKAKPRTEEKTQTEAVEIDTGLNNAEETVINFNQYLNQKNTSYYNDKDVDIKNDNDNKLLSLLDTLEQEVKHIALDGSEKELFDAKIRKIYGSIVGKTALQKFPKSIIKSTTDQETPEIDFGETKSSNRLESDHEEGNHIKDPEEPRQPKRYQIDKGIGRMRNSIPSIQGHKWKTKFIDSFDQKKYKENIDGFNHGEKKPADTLNHKYDANLGHSYGDIDHKHMDDLDRTYNENINKKYSENHLDHEYNDDQVKLSENFHHQHHYNLDKIYNDDNEPSARSKNKYVADRHVFREFEHNSRSSQEDMIPRDFSYKDLKGVNQGNPDVPLITKDREKRKKNERKHRKRVKSLNSPKEPIDPLSLERRKYYQEKLDNIKRKLRSRRNRGNNDPRNERSMHRLHTENREPEKTRMKSQSDNFYMPERARFLHGF